MQFTKRDLRKACIRVSLATKTPMNHFLELSPRLLAEPIEDVKAVQNEK